MSPSKAREHTLVVEAPDADLSVRVTDASGELMGECRADESQLALTGLPRGLYTVETAVYGRTRRETVRLDQSLTWRASRPLTYSAAPVPGAETTHEYYTEPAWRLSCEPTAKPLHDSEVPDAALLLFVRAPHDSASNAKHQLASVTLRAPDGRLLHSLDEDVETGAAGWSGFSTLCRSGSVVLEDVAGPRRSIVLPLWRGWQTQVFAMHASRLLWEDLRVMTTAREDILSRAHRSPYDAAAPDIAEAMTMDEAQLALQNGHTGMADRLYHEFSVGQSMNPMLGLLCAYTYLHRRHASPGRADREDVGRRIEKVIDALARTIPDSPDVAALRILARADLHMDRLEPVRGVPLFRAGAEALIRAADSHSQLVPADSLLDRISTELYGDSIFTTWKPPERVDETSTHAKKVSTRFDFIVEVGAEDLTEEPTLPPADWLEMAIVDSLSANTRAKHPPTPSEIASSLRVPERRLRAAAQRVTDRFLMGGGDAYDLDAGEVSRVSNRIRESFFRSELMEMGES